MAKNSINAQYNKWVKKNFKGLSAHTLKQTVLHFMKDEIYGEYMRQSMTNVIDTDVYVHLYNYFTGSRTVKCVDTYNSYKNIVDLCKWL